MSSEMLANEEQTKISVPLSKLLKESILMKDLQDLQNQKLISFPSGKDLNEAFSELAQNNILCAPVYDEATKQYIGLLDMNDFLTYILSLFGKESKPPRTLALVSKQLIDLSKTNPFVPITEDSTVETAIDRLCKDELHRMPVVSKTNSDQVLAMLSQSSISKFLIRNKTTLGADFCERTIEKLHVGAFGTLKTVKTAHENDILLDVLQMLHDNKMHGCPIVNDQNVIIGNISVSDLKYTVHNNLHFLSCPVKELLESLSRKDPVICFPHSTLMEVMETMVKADVHRIYVVDDAKHIIGVITYTDILDAISLLSKGSIPSW